MEKQKSAQATVQKLLGLAGVTVNGGNPWDIQVHNVDLYPQLNTEYPIVIVGAGAGTSFGGSELRFTASSARSNDNSLSLWARVANYIVFEEQCLLAGLTELRNIAKMLVNNSTLL